MGGVGGQIEDNYTCSGAEGSTDTSAPRPEVEDSLPRMSQLRCSISTSMSRQRTRSSILEPVTMRTMQTMHRFRCGCIEEQQHLSRVAMVIYWNDTLLQPWY